MARTLPKGWEVDITFAKNGAEGIEAIKAGKGEIVFLDLNMPVMDGYTLCKELKGNVIFSHIPIVLLTAQHQVESHIEGLHLGADAYLEKPFSLELLFAQINNLIQGREALHKAYAEKPFTAYSTLATTTTDSLFIKKMHDYIEVNIMSDSLSVESLAEAMNMSTSSLYRKVKGVSGLSPIDLVKIARLKKAVYFINNGETCINEIAYKVGFSSSSYFSTCFLKQYKVSPSEFIKNERSSIISKGGKNFISTP
jgi:YesN/AraC family two-component response regulator